jgi:predicted ATPase
MLWRIASPIRVLLLVNYRPEYRHEWTNKSYYSQLRLAALGRESAGEMLSALLGDGVELEPLKRLIIERTEGNPFFIEEMVQALFEDGALVRNGAVKVARSLSQLRLPPTVQGILASRIDRQSPEQKDMLQTLAVIGRESPLGLIGQVVRQPEAQLASILAALQAGEFIYQQPALTDVEYVFKHALTQEVAYNSVLVERRKLLHQRTGQVMEEMFAGQLDDHLSELARHYSQSDNVLKAIEYLGRAGEQAMQRSALAEAIISLNSAVGLLQKLPDSPERLRRELGLQLALGPALIPVKGWAAAEVGRAFTRARELCEQLDDPQALFHAMFGLWAVCYLRGELRTAYELAEELWRRAQSSGDSPLIMVARIALGDTLFSMGELLRAREQFEGAISLYDFERYRQLTHRTIGLVDAGVSALSYAAITLWALGYPDQALKRGNEALALAQALSHPHSLVFAEGYVIGLRQARRETHAAQEAAESVIALSGEYGFTDFLPTANCHGGWALAQQGRIKQGISQIEEGLAAARATGMELSRPHYLSLLAEAFMGADRLDDGLSALTEAKSAADQREERVSEAQIYRLKGELLLRQGDSHVVEAQRCFEQAIEIARKQSAKSMELRATISLARLLASQGRRDKARTMLAEIYNWFTEGFDTTDLKDAKALLDRLDSEP